MSVDPESVPVTYDDHGAFVVWDLSAWEGNIETFERINEAWLSVHDDPETVGTISVFPSDVIVDGEFQSFVADEWNGAGEAAGLEHLALVGERLLGMAVQNQIEMPNVTVETFQTVDAAVDWMDEQTA